MATKDLDKMAKKLEPIEKTAQPAAAENQTIATDQEIETVIEP